MAQYKVPQDVEAEDKLLGPFTFRQFIYLIIAAGSIALAWGLFQLFPFLALIPVPFIIFFAILALPLRKDQPMETYLAAVVSFYIKPRKRLWTAGERDSTILITAPKQTEEPRTRDITEEEAGHRLSFLADLVDTEGYAIKNVNGSAMRDEYAAEANATTDMLDEVNTTNIGQMIAEEQQARHAELVNQMRTAIARTDEMKNLELSDASIQRFNESKTTIQPLNTPAEPAPTQTITPATEALTSNSASEPTPNPVVVTPPAPATEQPAASTQPATPRPDMISLANNTDYSVQTIQKEANRLKEKSDDEVYISLH